MSESGYLAELSMDGLKLLLPQGDIRLLESLLDARPDPRADPGLWLNSAQGRIPVWSLDRQLRPLSTPPASRRFCALLPRGEALFALSIDGFRLVARDDCRLLAVPPALRLAGSPVIQLAVLGERILAVSDATRLAGCLPVGESPQ